MLVLHVAPLLGPCRWRSVFRPLTASAAVAAHSSYRSSTASALDGHETKVPVVIVGAGPTGLTLSLYLSRFGIPHVLLEKASELTSHPQAHFINNRTMEVFRPLDGLAHEVASLSPPLAEWRKFVYCESLRGGLLGEVDHFPGQQTPQRPDLSPVPLAHLAQHHVLPLMLRRAKAAAAGTASGSEILFGHDVKHVRQDSNGVHVTTSAANSSTATAANSNRHAASSSSSSSSSISSSRSAASIGGTGRAPSVMRSWSCRYLVAADGANSGVRHALGVQMSGEPAMQHLINIHFRSKRLGQLAAQRPAMLYFVFNADVVAVIVAHNIRDGEFVAQVPYFPPLQSPADFSVAVCQRMMQAAAGEALTDLQIRQVRPWTMSAQVADRFQVGRIFLAGDAAHRFPPAGGFGMNTGVQDAHNLAWKLSMVLRGDARPALLDSFEAERRPVALSNTALSVANWHEAIRVPGAMGLDPRAATLLNTVASSLPLPSFISKAVLQSGLSFGRTLAASPVALNAWRREQLSKIFSSGLTLRLQFPREDLGFCYDRGAVVHHGVATHAAAAAAAAALPWSSSSPTAPSSHRLSAGPSHEAVAPGVKSGGPPRAASVESPVGSNGSSSVKSPAVPSSTVPRGAPYDPVCRPGCRLPHLWLHEVPWQGGNDGGQAANGATGSSRPLSTLDLVAQCGDRFLLLVDGNDSDAGVASSVPVASSHFDSGHKTDGSSSSSNNNSNNNNNSSSSSSSSGSNCSSTATGQEGSDLQQLWLAAARQVQEQWRAPKPSSPGHPAGNAGVPYSLSSLPPPTARSALGAGASSTAAGCAAGIVGGTPVGTGSGSGPVVGTTLGIGAGPSLPSALSQGSPPPLCVALVLCRRRGATSSSCEASHASHSPDVSTGVSGRDSSARCLETGSLAAGAAEAQASGFQKAGTCHADGSEEGVAHHNEHARRVRVFEDRGGRWRDVMRLPAGSAVLVRPDGHVGWMHAGPPGSDVEAAELLHAALAQLLGG